MALVGHCPYLLILLFLNMSTIRAYDDIAAFLLQQQQPGLEHSLAADDTAALLGAAPFVRAALSLSNSSRVLLVSVRSLGLANRLRVLASAALAASDSGRILVIDWKPDSGCGAEWLDLFEDPVKWDGPSKMTLFRGQASTLDYLLDFVNWTCPVARLKIPGASQEADSVLVWRPRGVVVDFSGLLGADAPSIVVVKSGELHTLAVANSI